jgi:serine/threonine protein kinase
MENQGRQRIAELFEHAIDLSTSTRGVLLERECVGNSWLRHEVERLLAIDRQLGARNEPPNRPIVDGLEEIPETISASSVFASTSRADSDATLPENRRQPVTHDTHPAPGSVLGQYELIRQLGRGGMGMVYLARDLQLGRLVAIKLLIRTEAGLADRFLAEARATARCRHDNIVVIYEVGKHDAHPYMALEYLQGQTLRQWLAGRKYQAPHVAATEPFALPPLPPSAAVELIVPVVRALVCAHDMGIVHRDLKPENIMLTDTGAIKVLDFGIAKLLARPEPRLWESRDLAEQGTITATGARMGTLPYMSPEQLNGDVIDHRCDIWAVGIMLYEMVLGQHPLAPLSLGRITEIGNVAVPMPSAGEYVPDVGRLGAIIDRCLLKPRHDRTQTARELLSELEALLPSQRSFVTSGVENPFTGLASFQEADAQRFFGRDQEIVSIVAQLRGQPLVTITGLSGAGKSSLVRAGVIPALKRSGEGWDAYIVRPGRQPLAALAALLQSLAAPSDETRRERGRGADASGDEQVVCIERLLREPGYLGARLRALAISKLRRVLLFVDQFEELYTMAAPAREREAFLACLASTADDASSPLRVILAVRSDFLDRMAEDPRRMTEVTRGLVFLPPLGREGLREALTRPLEAAGFRFESPRMVETMLDALDATHGALPLLQFTSARLWEMRDQARRLLTQEKHDRIGGVTGALASHADAVMAGMSTGQQKLARQVFERLVTTERTRAQVSMREIRDVSTDPDAIDEVVQHLASMRLLVIENAVGDHGKNVEIVHESLIQEWPTLKCWLDDSQEHAAFLARLRAAAEQWERHGRAEGMLWRNESAREGQRWREHYGGELSGRETAYLDAVLALASRAARTKRWLIMGVIVFLLFLLMAASVALLLIRNAEQRASEQAVLARERAAVASQRLIEVQRAREQMLHSFDEETRARQAAQEAARDALVASEKEQHARATAEDALQDAKQASIRERRAREEAEHALRSVKRAVQEALLAAEEARKAQYEAMRSAQAERHAKEELQMLVERALGPLDEKLQ